MQPVRVLAAVLAGLALAQGTPAQTPDARGNYFSNQGPVQATANLSPRMNGSLWVVVARSLRARAQPSPLAAVVGAFPQGTVLQADVGRGGSDEVLRNARDAEGNPWMRVRTREGRDLNCYVRANHRYLRPLQQP